jgi:hypothetical protein
LFILLNKAGSRKKHGSSKTFISSTEGPHISFDSRKLVNQQL